MKKGIKLKTCYENQNVSNLQQILCKKEEDLNKTRATLDGIREERDGLRRKVHNLLCEANALNGKGDASDKLNEELLKTNTNATPISRKAERVKIKKTSPAKTDGIQNTERPLHGKDLDHNRLTTGAAEQLIHAIYLSSNFQEILSSTANCQDLTAQDVVQRFKLELERVNSRYDNLKSENNLLHLTLQETKGKMEQLHMLLSKFESNNSAHSVALFYSELTSKAYNAIIAILEKEILKPRFMEGILSQTKASHKKRLQSILIGLNQVINNNRDFDPSNTSQDLNEFIGETVESSLLPSDVLLLVGLCKQADERKMAVKRAIVNLEAFSIQCLQPPSPSKYKQNVTEFDLENAVLLHELTSVKEELVNLKCEYRKANQHDTVNLHDLHSSKINLRPKTSPAASYDCAFGGSALLSSEGEADAEFERNKKPSFLSLADLRIGTMTESEMGTELSDALKREQRLKKENEKLAFTLQQVQQNSEQRHHTSLEVMSNLKSAYSTLLNNGKSEKSKLKSHIHDLEQLISVLEENHEFQVTNLRQRILMYERDRENSTLPDNESAL